MTNNKYNKDSEKDFEKAGALMKWNKFLLSCLGLWPKMNKFLFLSIYYSIQYHFMKDLMALFLTFSGHNLMKVIGTGMECISLVQVCARILMLKKYNEDFVNWIKDFIKDYSIKNYNTEEERKIFLFYNSRSRKFISTAVVMLLSVSIIYITQPVIRQLSK